MKLIEFAVSKFEYFYTGTEKKHLITTYTVYLKSLNTKKVQGKKSLHFFK